MNNYDNLLREKENEDTFSNGSMEKHWTALEKKMDAVPARSKYRVLYWSISTVAAVSLFVFLWYAFRSEKTLPLKEKVLAAVQKSMIAPPLKSIDVPYEIFSFDAAEGDTLFTISGSMIVFPKNAVLNARGELVRGNIEVRTREFKDVFDYSIAGIPMDYDSAGKKYTFISSGMIDIRAFQNGELLQVNPEAKPQLNLVSTNKETKTNLYKLDTLSGEWIYKGNDEVNLVSIKENEPAKHTASVTTSSINTVPAISSSVSVPKTFQRVAVSNEETEIEKPVPPQKASAKNPVITVKIDPASFRELMVYDGMKFEIISAAEVIKEEKITADAAVLWDNVELLKGKTEGSYKVKFSAGSKTAEYNVKPVLEGKDFEAAEKLYQQKLKEYSTLLAQRNKTEQDAAAAFAMRDSIDKITVARDLATAKKITEENKKVQELNKLIIARNRYLQAENKRIEALNRENKRIYDSVAKVNAEWEEKQRLEMEKQQFAWQQLNDISTMESNLVRSFQIDGFGYWNCDQPTLPNVIQYTGTFKNSKNEMITYTNLCFATERVNRIQNFYNWRNIGLMPGTSYFGWACNNSQFYYFTKKDFEKAVITNNPNTITMTMNLYEGDLKNYYELRSFIFSVNGNNTMSNKQN